MKLLLLALLFFQTASAQRLAEVDSLSWRRITFGIFWKDRDLDPGKSYCAHLWIVSTNIDTVIFESPNSAFASVTLWTAKGVKVPQETPSLRYQTAYLEVPPNDTVTVPMCFKTLEIDTKFLDITSKDEDYILMDEWKSKAARNMQPGDYFAEFEFYGKPNIGSGEFNPFQLRQRFTIKE